jgi:hypothetical protein
MTRSRWKLIVFALTALVVHSSVLALQVGTADRIVPRARMGDEPHP